MGVTVHRPHPERFFQYRARLLVVAGRPEDGSEIDQCAGDGEVVLTLTIEGEHPPCDLEGVGMPSFVPAEKSQTPEAASQERGVCVLLGDPKGGGEGAV